METQARPMTADEYQQGHAPCPCGEFTHVRKVTVRDGAVVWQDFRAYHWRNDGCVFDAVEHTPGLWQLMARGYGVLGMGSDAYGNGALYVRSEDLVDVSNAPREGRAIARTLDAVVRHSDSGGEA